NLIAEGLQFKTFSVVHVLEGSPAAEAGIMQGDIVVAINGKGAAQLNLEDIEAIFHAKSSQMVEIIVLRNKQYLSYSFWLKRLI
ncbi:MAG: PDZ domain-containing protein, partial [Ignavibacteria bacterium]|nr:PDZ domain-containing protein [Ignavibacteria bacterium]